MPSAQSYGEINEGTTTDRGPSRRIPNDNSPNGWDAKQSQGLPPNNDNTGSALMQFLYLILVNGEQYGSLMHSELACTSLAKQIKTERPKAQVYVYRCEVYDFKL